jgi:hypothetical protein
MAFPATPLPVHVYIAPGVNPAGDPGDWTWEEITDDVRVAEGIEIVSGRADEAARVDASTCRLTIDNRSGNYSPRNPMGAWYGLLAKNTPLQVRMERGYDEFARVRASGWGTATDGQHNWFHGASSLWTADGTKALQTLAAANTADDGILGGANAHDVDTLYACSLPVVTTGNPLTPGAIVRYMDDLNQYRVFTEFHPGGVLKIAIMKTFDGASAYMATATLGITYAAGQIIWTRVQADGPTIRARCWHDGSPEPSTWQCSTSEATQSTGTGVGIYVWRHSGNTNVGSLVTSFYHYETTSLMFTGTVSEWPIRWDKSANDCTTAIEASGILRRLNQGQSALRSPMYRQLTGYNPAGYWPMEDGSDATAASSAAVNGQAATTLDVTFAADESLPGASTVTKLNSASSTIRGRVLRSTGTGFAAMFLLKLNAMPASMTTFIEWAGSGTVKTWRIKGDALNMTTEGLDSDGTVLTTMTTGYGPSPTEWIAYQLEAVQSGGNISWAMVLHQVGSTTFYSHNGTPAGTVGTITAFLIPGSTGMTDALVAHVYAGADTLPFVGPTFRLVSNGYAGELAADRVQRLCDEEGVRVYVESGDSRPMGRQRSATFLELLRSCEDADTGVLYEIGSALAYKPYGARLDVSDETGLDFNAGDIADPPEPTDDDQRVRNDITITRQGGGQTRAADEPHIDLNGRYDESMTVNVQTDDQLPDIAAWLLHLGTWDEMRWPSVTMDLARNPHRIGQWHGMMQPGSRLVIDNPPDQVLGDTLDLTVEGHKQTLGVYDWDVELSCSPARPWDIAVTDDDDARVDTIGSTLASDVDDNDTALSVTSTDEHRWTTDVAEFPFDVNLGGERITVTAISGASNPQTFTVTRSVNGVIMPHDAGTDVRLWTPAYVSL